MNDRGAQSGAGEPHARAETRELDLFDLAAFVWTKKLLAILVTVLVFVPAAVLAWFALEPVWRAESRLLVILDQSDLTPGAAGSGGAFTLDQVMQSETEILNSDAVRRRALEARTGAADPRAVAALREGFAVSRAPNASVLSASFEGDTPEGAANTLNALIDAYLAYRVELLVGGPEGAVEGRLAAAEAEAARAEQALRVFLNANNIADFETERQAVLQRIADLQARTLSAEAEASQARAFAASLNDRLREIPQEIALYVENSVTGRLLDLEVRREELLSRYLPDAPPVQTVDREIAALRAFIDAGGADGRGQTRTGINPIWQELEQERLQQDAFARGQERLAAALQIQLRDARAEADRLRGLAPEHDRLVRAATARAGAAELLSVEAADASARRNAPPGAADAVRVVERAAPPARPDSLRRPAVMAAFVFALGCGVFVALLAGYLDHRSATGTAPQGPDRPGRRDQARRTDRAGPPARHLPVLARLGEAQPSAHR
ncbi:MAG: Wzz/FepE/Etk N-terminal domain-containing protein [Oceanicaulis sp.]